MKRKINKIKIFHNDNKKSKTIANILTKKLLKNNFIINDEYELAIAIGGDGSFLRMVNQTNFNQEVYYIGINTGTLGFAQEVNPNHIDSFIKDLNNNKYKIDNYDVQKTIIETKTEKEILYSLNEITIREEELNTIKLKVYVDGYIIEKFEGDGLLIASTFGSTAYNLSFGGSIIHPSLKTQQITPIAPLNNRSYKNLINSLILPIEKDIIIKLDINNLLISCDGKNKIYNKVNKITITKRKKGIKIIRLKNYNFAKTINEKFLK